MKSYEFFIQTDKKNIDFINKIIAIEIYKTLIEEIIEDFSKNGMYIEVEKQCIWEGII